VIVMRVRVDDERLVELHLDRADLLEVGADQPVAVAAGMHLAFSGAADDRLGHPGIV